MFFLLELPLTDIDPPGFWFSIIAGIPGISPPIENFPEVKGRARGIYMIWRREGLP